MTAATHEFQADIAAIAAMPVVGTILEVACHSAGLRFAAVSRVSGDRWICCASRDEMGLGLKPGDEIPVEPRLRDAIRDRGGVVIDDIATDETWRGYTASAKYGFQSYISMPIAQEGGRFFGTLCAIDAEPHRLNTPPVTGMFRLFAQLIAHELDMQERLKAAQDANDALQHRFRGGLGHDMRNTLAAMEAGARLLGKSALDSRGALIVSEMEASAKKLAAQIADAMKVGS
jgi:GAF domain-containing protein